MTKKITKKFTKENAETINTLGKFLPDDHDQHRDAVHIAVMPVVAGEELQPGEKVRIKFGTTDVAMSAEYNDDYVGLVDPFLKCQWEVKVGQKFWLWLRPGTITGLRHEWTHPVLDKKQEPVSESETWLRQFADKWNFDYNEMLISAVEVGGYITARGKDLHSAGELDPGDEDLFWQHIQTLTKKELDDKHKQKFCWSCTC